MPRRPEPAEPVAARDLMRAKYDAQLSAVAAFFDTATRLAALRGEVEAVEADQQIHAAALAELLGLDGSAHHRVVENRLGEAQRADRPQRESRRVTSGGTAGADVTAADDAPAPMVAS